MRAKTKIRILSLKKWMLGGFLVLMVALVVLRGVFFDNQAVAKALQVSMVVLAALAAAGALLATIFVARADMRKMGELFRAENYAEAKRVFLGKGERYLLGSLKKQAKLYALMACFAQNDIDEAKAILFGTKWGYLASKVKYFEILLNLKDENLDEAYANAQILTAKGRKNGNVLVEKVEEIFACIEQNDFATNKFYEGSIYPIMEEIYQLYQEREKRTNEAQA